MADVYITFFFVVACVSFAERKFTRYLVVSLIYASTGFSNIET